MTEDRFDKEHLGELLSGYLDGELTQQDEQRVRLLCESNDDYARELESLKAMRERVGNSKLSDVSSDVWRETMDETGVKASRGIGWLLLIGGALIGAGALLLEFFSSSSSMSLQEKLIVGGIYGGLLFLFISVLRQRLIERKTDKYKDVEI